MRFFLPAHPQWHEGIRAADALLRTIASPSTALLNLLVQQVSDLSYWFSRNTIKMIV